MNVEVVTSPMRSSARTLLAGAVTLASTGVLVRLADVGAATASFWRCIIALVVLLPLAAWEAHRFGRPGVRQIGWGLAGGALLGADFLLWTQSVLDAGSGIANVVLNVQVIAFPLLALRGRGHGDAAAAGARRAGAAGRHRAGRRRAGRGLDDAVARARAPSSARRPDSPTPATCT